MPSVAKLNKNQLLFEFYLCEVWLEKFEACKTSIDAGLWAKELPENLRLPFLIYFAKAQKKAENYPLFDTKLFFDD